MCKKIIFSILFFSFILNGFSQFKIEESKKELTRRAPGNNQHRTGRSHGSSGHFANDGSLEGMILGGIFQGFMYVTYYAAIGNYAVEDHLYNNLTQYPFYNSNSYGNYSTGREAENRKLFRVDLSGQYLSGREGLSGDHFKFKLRPFQYFYLQVDYIHINEKSLKIYDSSNLTLYNFNLCYDRVRLENFNLGWTLGCNYIGGDVNQAGFSYGLNGELFFPKSISLFSSMKWSLINNSAVNQFEIQGKYHFKRGFISMGYEYFKIATPTYNFFTMGGGIYL